MIETLWQDVRYGFRTLVKSPGFAAVAILILAIGIAANGIVFSMIKGVLLRPLPGVRDPDKLVVISTALPGGRHTTLSYPDFVDLRDRNEVFASLVASSPLALSVKGEGADARADRAWGEIVSGNYFQTLGVRAAMGRTLQPDDDRVPGGHPVCFISHGLWQRRFGSDPSVVGKSININGQPFTVVGVAEKGFMGSVVGLSLDLFVPLMMQAQLMPGGGVFERRDVRFLQVKGYLRPGVALPRAQAAMKTLAANLAQEHQPGNDAATATSVALFPLWQSPFGAQRQLVPVLTFLMGVAALVLLIICANVANLLLARATARGREIAIRLAVGAGRGRLVRQLLTESLLLAVMGGAVGLLLTAAATGFISRMSVPVGLPLAFDLSPDRLVLGFTLVLSLLTGVVFGLMPALQATRPDLTTALKDEVGPVGGRRVGRSRLRSLLVVGQVAVSLVLLVGAGLLIRSSQRAQEIDPGFKTGNVLLVTLDLQTAKYDEARGRLFFQQLTQRVGGLPGVESVSFSKLVPLRLIERWSSAVQIEGYEPRRGESMSIDFNIVGPNYLRTMGIPLARGRDFSEQDAEKNEVGAAVINETMARRFWPNQDPVGKRLKTRGAWRQIVGVAKDSKYNDITEEALPHVYLPFAQNFAPEMTLEVRTAGDPKALLPAVKSEVQRIDGEVPVLDAKTLSEHVAVSLSVSEAVSELMSVMGGLALLLAGMGIYGVVAYSVRQRTHEIGIRMALGAGRGDILRLIMRQGVVLALVGMSVGLAAALALSRFLASLLYGVSPNDPVIFAGVSLLLVAVVLVATFIPARWALRVEPMACLRSR